MSRNREWIKSLILLLFLTSLPERIKGQETKVLCYFANWSEERNEEYRLFPKDIDPWLCTHIVYAFAMPDLQNGIVPMDFLETFTEGGSDEFSKLKRLNPNLKLMLSVGGWDEGSIRFSKIVSDPDKREWFAEYATQFVRGVGFDGLDVNWQWPGLREGSNSGDRDNLLLLLKTTKKYMEFEGPSTNRTSLLLSVVVPPLKAVLEKGFKIAEISRVVDFVNVLTMEYHTATDPVVNHQAPLFGLPGITSEADLNADATIDMYIKLGLDRRKLNMGIPFYGHSYLLESPVSNSLGSLAEDEGTEGFGTRLPGTLAYYEICKYVKDEGWIVKHPNRTAMGPYAYRDKEWVAYDDSDIVKRKARYAREKNLGGVMLWTIDLDDFNALCNESFPLTRAVRQALSELNGTTPTTESPAINLDAGDLARPLVGLIPTPMETIVDENQNLQPSSTSPDEEFLENKSSGDFNSRPNIIPQNQFQWTTYPPNFYSRPQTMSPILDVAPSWRDPYFTLLRSNSSIKFKRTSITITGNNFFNRESGS